MPGRGSYTINGITYSSFKHPMLEWVFKKYNPNLDSSQPIISFTLQDISDGYRALGIHEPASISNTILDLTRQDRGITSRLPQSIINLGYDLRKKTGKSNQTLPDGSARNYAGEFIYVGVGNVLHDWLVWGNQYDKTVTINPSSIPRQILPFIRHDEGALFSVADYCDIFSQVFGGGPHSVVRVQNPLKWQPNEIDGFYHGTWPDGNVLYPVEAKALTTGDDVNLVQMLGGIRTLSENYAGIDIYLQPVAARMISNGIQLAIFQKIKAGDKVNQMTVTKRVRVIFDPVFVQWT